MTREEVINIVRGEGNEIHVNDFGAHIIASVNNGTAIDNNGFEYEIIVNNDRMEEIEKMFEREAVAVKNECNHKTFQFDGFEVWWYYWKN